MLTYHPIFDSNHCLFRILYILNRINTPLEVDRVRLFDFYLSAPHSLKLFRTNSTEVKRQKNSILKSLSRYDEIDNSKALFYDAKSIQTTVLNHLAAKNIISVEKYKKSIICLNDNSLDESVISIVKNQKSITESVANLIESEFQKIPLLGNDGLKHRSNLMEYRYDVL